METSYITLPAERISQANRRKVVVTNLLVSMATNRDVVRCQLPRLVELNRTPDILTLDIGGNDVVLPGNILKSFEKHSADIPAQLPPGNFVAGVFWLMLPVLSRWVEKFNDAVTDLIVPHGHHRVCVHDATRGPGPSRYHVNTAADWFHPNDTGYRAQADFFWKAIESSGLPDLPGFSTTGSPGQTRPPADHPVGYALLPRERPVVASPKEVGQYLYADTRSWSSSIPTSASARSRV